jgi:predicted ATPase
MRLLARDPADRPDDQQVMAALGLTPSPWTLRIAAREAATRPDGREADLELLRRALADSRDHPVCALVTGPRESGKTTLIDAFVAETRARGDVVVFAGRASNREAVPYRAIDRIVDGLASWLLGLPRAEAAALLPPGVSALCRVFPTLRRVPAAQVPTLPGALPTDEVQLRDKAFDALRALIAAIAERHPLVMVADDMQWATPEGVPILDRFLHTKVRCLMLFGLRSDEGNRVLVDHLAAWGGDLRTISLSPVPAVAPE